MKEIQLDFRPLIHKLEVLTKKFVESEYTGESPSLQKKKGLEFEDFKSFAPGDDATMIDWKASLRTGELLIRQFTQLKTLNIFIIVDVSNSMLFSSISKLKCEYAAELAASLAHYFLKSDDLVSLSMINDKMVQYITPSFGSRHFAAITKSLGNPDYYGGKKNFTTSLSYLTRFIRAGSVVILISDFIGLEKNFQKTINAIADKSDVIALMIRDPEDQRINEKIGHTVIEDPFSDELMFVDMEKAKEQYAKEADKILKGTRLQLKKGGVDSLVLETDSNFVDPLMRFFAKRNALWQ